MCGLYCREKRTDIVKLAKCSVTDASGKASSPEAREAARTFAYDPQQIVSPFPGAYWTGSGTQSSPSTRLIIALLVFTSVLMGAFVFMLARGVH
jgi:hypothetical protein